MYVSSPVLALLLTSFFLLAGEAMKCGSTADLDASEAGIGWSCARESALVFQLGLGEFCWPVRTRRFLDWNPVSETKL